MQVKEMDISLVWDAEIRKHFSPSTIRIHNLPTHAAAHRTSSGATYFPQETFFFKLFLPGNMLQSRCFLLVALAKPQHKQQRPYRAPAADMSAQLCIYLNLPTGPGGPAQASSGTSPACLRIHSHLCIKLLTDITSNAWTGSHYLNP